MKLTASTSISLSGPLFSPDTAALARAGLAKHVTAGLETLKTEVGYAMSRGTPTVFNFGNLMNSLTTETKESGNTVEGVLGTTKVYAPVMEYGRRPGAPGPPSAPLVLWAKRKLGGGLRAAGAVGRFSKGGKSNRGNPTSSQKDAWYRSMGFVIARSIHKKGIEAKAPFARGQAAAQPRIESELNAAAAEFARNWGVS